MTLEWVDAWNERWISGILPVSGATARRIVMTNVGRSFAQCSRSMLVALLASFALGAAAQDYPAKVVRIVVPFPAGGSTDAIARLLGQKLSESLGQNFIVENRPGATGTIAGALVAKSAADGYTLMVHSSSSYTAPFLYSKPPYDGARAFTPVIRCVISGLALVSSASLPVKDVKELVALARRRPNEVTFGTVGLGSIAHLAAEMFNSAARVKTVAVAYKGAAPTLIALASGEVGFSILNLLDPQPFVKQGKLRSLAVTSAKRSVGFPDVPTLMESGVGVEAYLYQGLFAPAGTPVPVVNKLNAEVTRIIGDPQTMTWFVNNVGGEFAPHSAAQFGEFLASDVAGWQKVVARIGLKLD
jgi:tripartite-type tricarboxylate transporter receptor subunit TctC